MLFYRDMTLDSINEERCPICNNCSLRKSLLLAAIHDIDAFLDFTVMTAASGTLLFFAVYEIKNRFGLEIRIPEEIGWMNGLQATILLFLTIGAIISHFLLTLHLKIGYFERGYSLVGSKYCPHCDNRFLVLISLAEENEEIHIDNDEKEDVK